MKIKWKGKGINEKAYDDKNNVIIECNKKYFRPSEVKTLLGNPLKAKDFKVETKNFIKITGKRNDTK